jgi:hypothetical protein
MKGLKLIELRVLITLLFSIGYTPKTGRLDAMKAALITLEKMS